MCEEKKYCTLVFDEMKIKNFLEHSKYLDLVEGYEDLGPKGRTNKLAGQAIVMIIRGVYSSWKMLIAYFLPATSVKHKVLSELLEEAVKRLFDCGRIVKALICDQGASNVTANKDLGITKDKPYFFVDSKKFLMFHTCSKILEIISGKIICCLMEKKYHLKILRIHMTLTKKVAQVDHCLKLLMIILTRDHSNLCHVSWLCNYSAIK